MERRRYALRLAYEGGRFRGFQAQPGLPTVQAALETALASAGIEASLQVAARTDAGVHALDQVVGLAVRRDLDPAELRARLNAALPEGLACLAVARAPASFHARASALARTYVYLVGAPAPAEAAGYAWSLPDGRAFPGQAAAPLDVAAMRRALAAVVGEHDFSGLARPGEQRGTRRTVLRAEVLEAAAAPLVALVLEARGFLRAMARNIVGTAVTVGLGRSPPTRLAELMEGRGPYRGVRAPGWGLTLARVTYPPGLLDWEAPPPDRPEGVDPSRPTEPG